jgi:hypothetical protein
VIAPVADFGRRACAALAACSAVLHGISLGRGTNLAAAGLTAAMAAGCLYCARDLWVRGTLRAWVLVALMNLTMIAIHAPAPAAHHHGGGVTTAAPAHHSTVMNLAATLATVEVVAAAVLPDPRSSAYTSEHRWLTAQERMSRSSASPFSRLWGQLPRPSDKRSSHM